MTEARNNAYDGVQARTVGRYWSTNRARMRVSRPPPVTIGMPMRFSA